MRLPLLLLVAAGALLAPLAPASASCDLTLDGRCVSGCAVAAGAYGTVRDTAGGKVLPVLDCPA
jgi:hypothetical protein